MGFDIEISQYDVAKCPHCGKPIKGTRRDWTESGGPAWRDFLKEIGYYVPYDKRTPKNDWYGKDMTLTAKQAKGLAAFARTYDVYGRANICAMVEDALTDGDFMAMKSATSLANAPLMGSQEPSERIAPEYQRSDGLDAAKLVRVGGTVLDPWQGDVLDDWMGFTPAGKWSAPTAGGSVPRQNGKSLLIQARCEAGMLMYNEQVIYTAHLQKTATETFEEMRDFFEGAKLRRYVAEIKTAIGREQIILKSGARIKFLARTRNGGRGQHGDLLIFDEAQELDANQQASFLPAISASLNPQTLYLGTPPDETAVGTVFRGIRGKALEGESRKTAWFEFSVPEIGDVHDKRRWAAANPALGRRIQLTTIEGEAEQMDADTFARERLGWWSPVATEQMDYALDKAAWEQCSSEELKPEGKTAYGVKFAADGSAVCLCGAVIPKDGAARVSLIEMRPSGQGYGWLADWLNVRYDRASCVVIDGRNGVDVLVERIRPVWKAKNSVIRPGTKDVIAAVGGFTNSVNEHSLTWYRPQTILNESAVTAIKRPIGGGYGFGGDNSLPVEACALALWGAKTCKRDPTRKMRIG